MDTADTSQLTCAVPLVGHALGVTDADGTLHLEGPVEQVFPLASVSKPIAALGVLRAVALEQLSLEDPAGPEGCTVRHLLAHAAGLAFDAPTVLAAPGARRMYSNAGFEILGRHLEESTGYEPGEWVHDQVAEPLGLTRLDPSGSPAKDYRASVEDLLALGREMLRPTLLPADLWAEATTVQFPGIPGLLPGFGRQEDNTWGLGVEIRGRKAPHWTGSASSPQTFGHFGQSGSFLWVDPQRGLAAAYLGPEPFGPQHAELWPRVTDEILERFGTAASTS
ncbi:serine hydrolase domain-containing protein [Brachybacterium sillae]|uniref:serine hydrolase domain-containing protein n=1 Tax=Brachybacterium sillae TaxID=2810536 RepID=UPI00217D4E73|nr:serine hydrolase domain-containing protein [Brachybacterium sillae]